MDVAVAGVAEGDQGNTTFDAELVRPLDEGGDPAARHDDVGDLQYSGLLHRRVELLSRFEQIALGALTAGDVDIDGAVGEADIADLL